MLTEAVPVRGAAAGMRSCPDGGSVRVPSLENFLRHCSGSRCQYRGREGQGSVRQAHGDRKDWIKEQFGKRNLHKPSAHTWTQAEGRLRRYLEQKPTAPAPRVEIAEVLRQTDTHQDEEGFYKNLRGPL